MKYKLLHEGDLKTWAVVLDCGDEAVGCLTAFAKENHLTASQVTGIGAFRELTIGFFVTDKQDYNKILINEQVEVLSLVGDITGQGVDPKLHAHVVVGKQDGSAHGGHLIQGRVSPTLEVIVTETPKHLVRRMDPRIGLALIDLDAA